jgi:DNA-binding CsgD family transcriptional regulator
MFEESAPQLDLALPSVWPRFTALDPEGPWGVCPQAEDDTALLTPASAGRVSGHLLDLLQESDRLMREVQGVLQRIHLELGRSGISLPTWHASARPRALPELDSLSRRETEIVQLFMDGNRVSNIASTLFISQHTVRNHLQSVFRKLEVSSQAELIEKLKDLQSGASRPAGPSPRDSSRPLG